MPKKEKTEIRYLLDREVKSILVRLHYFVEGENLSLFESKGNLLVESKQSKGPWGLWWWVCLKEANKNQKSQVEVLLLSL